MMKRILIVGGDAELSRALEEVTATLDSVALATATTVREACLLVTQEPFDLALTTVQMADNVQRALHALQPQLVVRAVTSEEPQGEAIAAGQLADALRELLLSEAEEDEQPAGAQPASEPAANGVERRVSHAQLKELPPLAVSAAAEPAAWPRLELLEQAVGREQLTAMILMDGSEVSAASGTLSGDQVRAIAQQVQDTWGDDGSALLQFVQLAEQPASLLLLTKPAGRSRTLTLAAPPDHALGRLRRVAERLAASLAREAGEPPARPRQGAVVDTTGFHTRNSAPGCYALILQARKPMPAMLQKAVAQALQDVADEAGCELHHTQIQAQIVHFVTTCPGDQGSGWLANLYKQGVEARLQEQFGIPARLWRRGFYATESDRALSDIEIKLFSGQ